MFEATNALFTEEELNQNGILIPTQIKTKSRKIGIIRKFEFASKLSRMSVVTTILEDGCELLDPKFSMYIKGSPE